MMKSTILFCIFWVGLFSPISLLGQFSYPSVPDSIREIEDRASYLSDHWWDNTILSDTTLFQSPKIILDYLYVLEHVSMKEKKKGLEKMVGCLSIEPHNLEMAISWLKKYLHDASSPYYDDGLYVCVIDETLEHDYLPHLRPWLNQERNIALRNMSGNVAEDFTFVTSDSVYMKMSDISSQWLLIIFNNPDCSRCRKMQQHISNDTLIQELMVRGWLKVLAICPVGDYTNWKNFIYPNNWITGFDLGATIVSKQLYEIQNFPSLYLLDYEKRVCVKEAQKVETITNFIKTKKHQQTQILH